MKIIKRLSEYIHEEICDAEKYVRAALEYKTEYSDIADTLYMLSTEELQHMRTIHNMVVNLIQAYRKEHGEPPAAMLAMYQYLHEKAIDDEKEVKILQEMYKQ